MNLRLKLKILKSRKPQYLIAKLARINYQRLSGIIHEYKKPSQDEKERLAKVLGCKVRDIFSIKPKIRRPNH
jgi:hypothetical protein